MKTKGYIGHKIKVINSQNKQKGEKGSLKTIQQEKKKGIFVLSLSCIKQQRNHILVYIYFLYIISFGHFTIYKMADNRETSTTVSQNPRSVFPWPIKTPSTFNLEQGCQHGAPGPKLAHLKVPFCSLQDFNKVNN